MGIEHELKCIGLFGFGGGVKVGREGRQPDGALYCGKACPLAASCWDGHKDRVRRVIPSAAAEFDRMAETVKGPELVKLWTETYRMPDPYSAVMSSNIEDGLQVGAGGKPKDRGAHTLQWPMATA